MVRGSSSDPEGNDTKIKRLYDGTLANWPVAKIKIKALLYRSGLWDVTERGPSAASSAPPAPAAASPAPAASPDFQEPAEYYYSMSNNDVQGPCTAQRILDVVNTLSSLNSGKISSESIYVFHSLVTSGKWEPWSSSLMDNVSSSRRFSPSKAPSTPSASSSAPTVPMSDGGTSRAIDFSSPTTSSVSARDREVGQQRACDAASDVASFHTIISSIDDSVEAGEMLILTVAKKFDTNESGHLLFKFLDDRASCGSAKEGLVNADELRRKIDDWHFCEGKEITLEELTIGSEHFQRMWEQQPMQRQGLGGDMFDYFTRKLPANPFINKFIANMNAVNVLNDGALHTDYSSSVAQLRALYAHWLKTNSPVKGKSSSASGDALVGDSGKGKGKGKGGPGGRGGGKGGPRVSYCFRCWAQNDHWAGTCPEPPGVCTACGLDSAAARLTCGGEKDPRKCIVKGYRPAGGVSAGHLAKLQEWAKSQGVAFSEVSGTAPRALASPGPPSLIGAPPYAASVVGPADSVSVAGGVPPSSPSTALAASQGFDPNAVTWTVVDGVWRPSGGSRAALVAPSALISYGGRSPLAGEIDCVVDGACTSFCVPDASLLSNLRAPEIDGMHVGDNTWCPATATGDLLSFAVDGDGNVTEFNRVRHVVPGIKWHLHGETPEFESHGGVVFKGAELLLRLRDATELPLLPGSDGMVRLPLFRTRECARQAASAVLDLHAKSRAEASRHVARLLCRPPGAALLGQSITSGQADKYLLWHAILGCKGDDSLRATLSNSVGHGSVVVPHDAGSHFGLCEFCNTQKLVAQPYPDATHHAAHFGERVLIDDLGPFPVPCVATGAVYVRKFTDEATGLRAAYPLTSYNAEETVAVVRMFMGDHAHLLPPGKTYTIVRTDGGSVLRAECVRDLFDEMLVSAEASMPRVPQQMGQNESAGRDMPCGPEYAVLGVMYACDVYNLSFHKTWRGNTCPHQLATGRQPDLSHLHAFGAVAFCRVTSQERPDKLSEVGLRGQYVGLARGYSGAKLLIRDQVNLQRAGIGGVRPSVYVHSRTKLGIDIRVDDLSLARLGRKLLPSLADPASVSSAYPRSAPSPPAEAPPSDDEPGAFEPARSPPDEGAPASASSDSHPPASKPKPRKTYLKERPDGSKWQTRQSTRVENSLLTHATEAEIVSNGPGHDGMGAYFTTDEMVHSFYLGDLPEHQWNDDDLYALVHFDEFGDLHVVGDEVKRHPYLVRVDKPGVDIQSVALMAKIGDDADGVHVFSGRSDISNEPDAEEWIKARGREVQQLRSIPTWKHVKLKVLRKLGIKPTRTMFVDKVKRTDQNKIEEFKSRGVACHFNAVAGRDFVDKFWHIARDSSINTTLAKGTQHGVTLYQFDLPAFYLQADPQDANFEHEQGNIIYISMLPGYEEKDDDGDEAAGVLTAAMYGTAVAGRAAGRKLSKDFIDFGFSRGVNDHAVYHMSQDGSWLEVCCIVDDMVVADYGDTLIHKFHDWLQLRWGSGRTMLDGTPGKPIKFGPLNWCLGRKVRVNKELGIVMVTGPQYIEDMAKKYMTDDAAALVEKFKADIPCDKSIVELSTEAPRQLPDAASLTRSLVQSLSYAAHKFKNEILYAVARLQRFADNPCLGVYKCALQVLKYCVHDKATRSRSTTGIIFFWQNGPISVRSAGQKFQSITSTDAESHGIASAMYEGIVIRGHLKWSGVPLTKPTRLENDNSGGVLVARDAASMHHSRATAMRAVFCQECVEQGMYDPVHVPAESMTADVLTKWLPLNDFARHRAKLTNRRAQVRLLASA